MKTIEEAIKALGTKWRGFFDALYWNETDGYYFAKMGYSETDFICDESEYAAVVHLIQILNIDLTKNKADSI